MPVDHLEILKALQPLAGGLVAGQCQTRRDGELVITAELVQSTQSLHEEWEGVLVRVISPAVGELAVNIFLFRDHGTLPSHDRIGRVYSETRAETLRGQKLADSIEAYVGLFR
ncbi:hypothetical protein [Kitasatospora griseola]